MARQSVKHLKFEFTNSLTSNSVPVDITKEVERNKEKVSLLDVYNHLYNCNYKQSSIYGELCLSIENTKENGRLMILQPRKTYKTSICSIANTIYRLIKDPLSTNLIFSENEDLARSIVWEIKDKLESNAWISKNFPYLVPQKKRTTIGTYSIGWRQTELRLPSCNTRTPSVMAGGLDKSITGHHFNNIIVDDIHSFLNTEYAHQLDSVYRKFNHLYALLQKNGNMFVMGTRYHFNDVYGRLIAKSGWKKIIYECYNKDGKAIFPSLPEETLEELKRDLPAYIFNAQYRNKIISDDTALFKKDFIRYYDYVPKNVYYFTACDPASSEDKHSDWTTIVTIAVDCYDKIYVVDADRFKTSSATEIAEVYVKHLTKYKPLWHGIEKRGFNFLIGEVDNRIEKLNLNFGKVRELKDGGTSKFYRIAQLEPYARRGDLFINQNLNFLEEEFLFYPRGNDDTLDALAYAVAMRIKPEREIVYDDDENVGFFQKKWNKIFTKEENTFFVGYQYDKFN